MSFPWERTPDERSFSMSGVLEGWGRRVYRLRGWLLILSLFSLAPAFVVVAKGARAPAAPVLAST